MIWDTLKLNADTELFLEKTLDDIHFIDQSLRSLLRSLEESPYLSERDELLDQLSNVEEYFSRVLAELLKHDGNLSVREIPSLEEKLEAVKQGSFKRQKTIGKLCSTEEEETETISPEEITQLLKAL